MKAPEDSTGTAPWQEFLRIPLDRLKSSLTQPRTIWSDEARLKMDDSVKAHGIIQPLLVRALPDAYYLEAVGDEGLHELCRVGPAGSVTREGTFPKAEAEARLLASEGCYEIIDGERRKRSADACGLGEAPVILGQYTDVQVMEMQLVSAMQREELSAIEEGQAMVRILALRDAAGAALHTTETLAVGLGQTVRTVQRRVKLARATGPIRAAVEAGTLPAKTADLLLGIPDEKLRAQATKEVLTPQFEAGPLSYAAAEKLIGSKFMVDLRDATFDKKDETLVPVETDEAGERSAGGACADCPLRSGNTQSVAPRGGAGEVKSGNANMCLNPTCYGRKKTVAWTRWQEEHTSITGQRRALSEQECLQLYAHGDQLNWTANLVDLNQHPDGEVLKAGVESAPKWKALVKGSEIEILVVRDRLGKTHELVAKSVAITAAETAGHKVFKRGAVEPEKTDDARKAEAMQARQERLIEERVKEAQLKALLVKVESAKKLPEGFWQLLTALLISHDISCDVSDRRGLDHADFAARLPVEEDGYIIAVLVDYAATMQNWVEGKPVNVMASWAALYGVDVAAIETTELAVIAAEQAALDEEMEIESGMKWMAPRRAKADFDWAADGCTNPDCMSLVFRKAEKAVVGLFVAEHEKGFTAGVTVKVGKQEVAEPCEHTGPFFGSSAGALENAAVRAFAAMSATQVAPAPAMERMGKYLAKIAAQLKAAPGAPEKKSKGKKGAK